MFERFLTTTAKKGYVALADQGMVSGTNFLTGVCTSAWGRQRLSVSAEVYDWNVKGELMSEIYKEAVQERSGSSGGCAGMEKGI